VVLWVLALMMCAVDAAADAGAMGHGAITGGEVFNWGGGTVKLNSCQQRLYDALQKAAEGLQLDFTNLPRDICRGQSVELSGGDVLCMHIALMLKRKEIRQAVESVLNDCKP
jgi:hypothetical protein